jgi:hypothetical protein
MKVPCDIDEVERQNPGRSHGDLPALRNDGVRSRLIPQSTGWPGRIDRRNNRGRRSKRRGAVAGVADIAVGNPVGGATVAVGITVCSPSKGRGA